MYWEQNSENVWKCRDPDPSTSIKQIRWIDEDLSKCIRITWTQTLKVGQQKCLQNISDWNNKQYNPNTSKYLGVVVTA